MAGLLERQLAKAIYAGFKGKLLKGTLVRDVPAESAGLDDFGDPNTTEPQTWLMQGFTDNYSDFSKTNSGIPETDLKVCIFAESLPPGVRPLKDDRASFTRNGVVSWFQLRKDGTDPAEALWVCQAYALDNPAPSP